MAELRKRGVLTAVVCSEPFRKLGTAQSRVFGTPELPLMMIPHPLGGLSIEQVQGRALVVIPQILAVIKEQLK
jgi:hypothetical protein